MDGGRACGNGPATAGDADGLPPGSRRSCLPDERGNLWVRHPAAPAEEAQRWSVLGSEGHWLGDVRTPAGLEVLEIGVDYVLGLWKDELGVQYVRMHPLLSP